MTQIILIMRPGSGAVSGVEEQGHREGAQSGRRELSNKDSGRF